MDYDVQRMKIKAKEMSNMFEKKCLNGKLTKIRPQDTQKIIDAVSHLQRFEAYALENCDRDIPAEELKQFKMQNIRNMYTCCGAEKQVEIKKER
jgi:hypothetical protein